MSERIIGMQPWFETPPGRYLHAWEQAAFDEAVADIFGFHALQLGQPALDTLRANRMPHRWLALPEELLGQAPQADGDAGEGPAVSSLRVALVTNAAALPFPEASLDLVVLPHTLEMSLDPHGTLREVERVLMPEGKVVICGLNPASLWGLRQRRAHLYRRLGFGQPFLPDAGEFIGWRLSVKYGIDDTTAVVLTDCKLDKLRVVELCEGGTVELRFRIGTSKIDERAIGQLAMMMDQEVPITLTGPKVAEPIDGTVDAFKRDHPDAPDAPPPAEAQRGENWPFPGTDGDAPPDEEKGEGEPAAAAAPKKPGRKPKADKAPKPPAVNGTTTDPTTAFVGAHAGAVQ